MNVPIRDECDPKPLNCTDGPAPEWLRQFQNRVHPTCRLCVLKLFRERLLEFIDDYHAC